MAATSTLIHHRNQDSFLVYLNIYDVNTELHPFFCRLGLGSTLSCVQVHGHEYLFGGSQHLLWSQGGPRLRRAALICLRRSILIGRTELDLVQVRETIRRLKNEYTAGSYHPFTNNCHHFSDRLCRELTGGNGIPWWVNRIAAFGIFCRCLPLPLPGADGHQPSIAAADDNGDADTDGTRNDHDDNGDDHEERHDDDGDHNTAGGDDDDEEPAYLEILRREMQAMSRPTATQEEAAAAPAPAATAAEAVPSNGGFWSSMIYQLSLKF